MTSVHYTAEVKSGLLLELPIEAQELHLQPGDKVNIQVEPTETAMPPTKNAASIALLKSWLEEDATDDPEELRVAEEELREFKRNMNKPRKETGARLLYPEVE